MIDKNKDKNKSIKEKNAEKDAIDMLPLESIPLASKTLKNAKLVKNARMETTVELYKDSLAGSLQVMPDSIADFMDASLADQKIISSLANLYSFDVYSLRTNLKKLGVEVEDAEALELSDDIKERLAGYNQEFVRPLIEKIFGAGRMDLTGKDALKSIASGKDLAHVKENLKIMADKTGIPLTDIPGFLEEYSDVFLSVAYYRYSFESVGIDIDRFLLWMRELLASREVMASPKMLAQCKQAEMIMRFLSSSIRERLAQFQTSFEIFWADINRKSFLQMRHQIEENHGSMGAVLCGLVVKINLWKKTFPNNVLGSPSGRAKFVLTEMEPGLAKLKDLETEARKRLRLQV